MIGKLASTSAGICCRLLSSRVKQLVTPSNIVILEKRGPVFEPLCHNYTVCKAKYSSTSKRIPVASYDEVKSLSNHPNKLLIDVREPNELLETGQIPGSINIPLGSVTNELSPDTLAEAFEKKYNRKKPHKDSEIIFHCKIGKRSADAAGRAMNLGYTNVKNYEGSWLDWAEREGLPK